MYRFNKSVWRRTHELSDKRVLEFSKQVFGQSHRYSQQHTKLTVKNVIDVCNEVRVPFCYFISTNEGEDRCPVHMEDIQVAEELWQEVGFSTSDFKRLCGRGSLTGLSGDEVGRRVGKTRRTLKNYGKEGWTSMQMDFLLNVCNEFGIGLDRFIKDLNHPLPAVGDTGNGEEAEKKEKTHWIVADCEDDSYRRPADGSGEWMVRPWRYNNRLMEQLHIALDVNMRELFIPIGLVNTTMQVKNQAGDIMLKHLIALCNSQHISSRHFITRGAGVQRPDKLCRADLVTPACKGWSEVRLPEEKLRQVLGLRNTATLRCEEFVRLCNERGVSPWVLIVDTNDGPHIADTTAERLQDEVWALRQDVARLRKLVKRLGGDPGED